MDETARWSTSTDVVREIGVHDDDECACAEREAVHVGSSVKSALMIFP